MVHGVASCLPRLFFTMDLFEGFCQICREKIGRAKIQLESNLTVSVKYNQKHIYKYINSEEEDWGESSSFIGCRGTTMTKDKEKAEVLSATFASVIKAGIGVHCIPAA